MAGISEEDIHRVREASDIVSVFSDRVPVRQKGRDFWCCCPIHEEKSPSCKIDPTAQLWHCFGCGAGGDVFSFVMKLDDLSFPDAVRKLAERSNIHISEAGSSAVAQGYKTRLRAVCKETAAFYHTQLMRSKDAGAAVARNYLSGRGLGGDIPKTWQLGFAGGNNTLVRHLKTKGFSAKEMIDANVLVSTKDSLKDRFYQRIIFPIGDAQGEVIAFGGRIVGSGQPKYLNSQETPIFHKSEVLFGLDKAKVAMATSGVAVVVEGYTDVIILHEAGISNVVATLGTALTGQHIRMLARHAKHKIVYLFDGDEAGQRAVDRALSFIDESITPEAGRTKIELRAVTLPNNLDPADFVASKGADALQVLITKAAPLLSYGIERRLARYDLTSAEQRSRAINDALSILVPIKDSLLAKDYAVQIAGKVRAREEDVLERLSRMETARTSTAISSDQNSLQKKVSESHTALLNGSLDQPELNRRRFERELLSLSARFPQLALTHAETLAQTKWHEKLHSLLADALLTFLAEKPAASAAELITAAQTKVPTAADILTSGVMTDVETPENLALFLAEELGMGDTEEAIVALKAQLADTQRLAAEEQELLFASVVAMQKDLTRRRMQHKPIFE